ncbi:hypothetical protein BC826DRAFT_158581 [Russula brevipes]|nr:hypothetical protein BC826DRAFT_158581 [Russula brevipes]
MGSVPVMLHLSLFLFVAGLVVLGWNISNSIWSAIGWWIWNCGTTYAYVTLLPILRHDSPYYTPFTSVVWSLYTGTLCVYFQLLKWITSHNHATSRNFNNFRDKYRRLFHHGIEKIAEESALNLSPEIDGRSLIWTLKTLDDDDQLERFFAAIPWFCNSKVVADPLGLLVQPNRETLSAALIGLMYRTLSSNLILNSVKMRRVKVCMEAMEVAPLPITPEVFNVLYQRDEWKPILSSVEFGLFLTKADHNDRSTAYYSQVIVSNVIANVQEHDERWFELATGQLGVPENVLRHYLAHGDSALLANCIHIIRCIVRDYSQPGSSIGAGSRVKTLKLALRLDMQSTLPKLQHEFCALWNEIVLGMWNTEDPLIQHASVTVLSHIRHLYLSLHEGTDFPRIAFSASTTSHIGILHRRSTYPLCDVPEHCPPIDSASQIWDVALGGTTDASPAPSLIFPYDDTTPTIVLSTPPDADAPSFPSPSPDYNGVHLSDAPSSTKVPATLQLPSPVATLPHSTPLDSHFSPAASAGVPVSGTTYGTIDASAIPSTASAVPYGDVRAGPQNAKAATVLPSTVPYPRLSPYLLPNPSRAPPSSSSDSATVRLRHNPHKPLSLATTFSVPPTKPQGASAMNPHGFTSHRPLSAHGSQHENPPILMEAPSRLCQSEPPTPGAATRTSRPGSRNSSRESASFLMI